MSITKSKKILEDVHPLDIINEVKKWPVLYRKDSPERLNFHFKNKIWHEVAKNLISGWDELTDSEKEVKDLNKKWRNLRDTFRRQVEVERKVRAGAPIRKRRYVYFKPMLFLLPHVAPEPEPEPEPESESAPEPAPRLGALRAERRARRPRRAAPASPAPSPAAPAAAAASAAAAAADVDEDRHFLMSLIPSFKRMSDDEKLSAKVEILKVIQQIRSASAGLVNLEVAYVEEAPREPVKVELLPEGADASDSGADDFG